MDGGGHMREGRKESRERKMIGMGKQTEMRGIQKLQQDLAQHCEMNMARIARKWKLVTAPKMT